MGNSQSNILERLDDIASDYILDADYQTLKNLKDQEYCNKVTIVTKDILDKQFNHLDIEYLAKRARTGWDWNWKGLLKKTPFLNRFNTVVANDDDDDENTVTYPDKAHVDFSTDIDNPNKSGMCLSISTFYVKIGHIFAAIVGTIKPMYVFKDGYLYSILTPKNTLPADNTGIFHLTENGFCYKRIETLKFGRHKDSSVMNPQFCNANNNYHNQAKDIPGVPEFEMLYYDETDKQGNPVMSDKNKKLYEQDLLTFYRKFTHQESLPIEVKRFSDIPLTAYDQTEQNCLNKNYTQPIQPMGSSRENPLFEDYANNLREMIDVTGGLQQKLIDILNKLFTKKTGEKNKVTIDPKVKMDMLDKMIVETRNILFELYLRCEEYFQNGVNIYKAIVDDRIINNTFDAFVAEEEGNYGENMYQAQRPPLTPSDYESDMGQQPQQPYPLAEDEFPHNEMMAPDEAHEPMFPQENPNYEGQLLEQESTEFSPSLMKPQLPQTSLGQDAYDKFAPVNNENLNPGALPPPSAPMDNRMAAPPYTNYIGTGEPSAKTTSNLPAPAASSDQVTPQNGPVQPSQQSLEKSQPPQPTSENPQPSQQPPEQPSQQPSQQPPQQPPQERPGSEMI